MLDRNLFLNDFDNTARRLARKGVDRETVERAGTMLKERKSTTTRVDNLRADLNKRSSEIGGLFKQGKKAEADAMKAEVAKLKQQLAEEEEKLGRLEVEVDDLLLRIPNLPDDRCPEGKGDQDNVVLRSEGYDPERFKGKTWNTHWDIGTRLGIYDAERAAKLSGSMFALLKNDGARLLRALVQFGLDLHGAKHEEILPPHFVTTETFTSTGHLPKFADDAYKLAADELWVIPTGEVPLTSMHRGEILAFDELPKRYMAYTVCFRREAGSAGKDTRGLQRLHEFHKVELVRLCAPEQVDAEFQDLLGDAEKTLRVLELPYRVVALCAGDLTFSSSRIYDLEVYSPGVDRWLEVSSVGVFTDFQTRRGNTRFRRDAGAKPEFLQALNGSGIATPRIWAAIIEHGQQPDGSVRLPKALVPYMGKEMIGP